MLCACVFFENCTNAFVTLDTPLKKDKKKEKQVAWTESDGFKGAKFTEKRNKKL